MIIYNPVLFLYPITIILVITGVLNIEYSKKTIEMEQKIIILDKDKEIQALKQEIADLQDMQMPLPLYFNNIEAQNLQEQEKIRLLENKIYELTNIEAQNLQEQEKIRLLENEIYKLTVKLDEMQNTINSISLKDFYWFGRKGIIAHVEINEGINIHCDSDDPESKKFCRNLKHALQKIIPLKARLSFKVIS